MLATFYLFSKRHNSTLLPLSEGTDIEVALKSPTSLLRPVLELQTLLHPTSWNYCHVMEFGRYYYVSDWSYDRGVWSCALSCDLLSSWKSEILATTAQVLFSSSDVNLQALDTRIATLATFDRQISNAVFEGLTGGAELLPKGYFALTGLSDSSNWATGAATTYFMTYQQMQTFARELIEPDTWESLKQYFTTPMDGVIDCYYLPIDVSGYVDLTEDMAIKIGDYQFPTATGKAAVATNLPVKSKSITLEIPWGYDDFRRLPPYSEASLFVPYCGAKSIDPALISDVEAILIDYSVDVSTGAVQAIAYVKQEVLDEFSGNMKISLPLAQTQSRVDSIVGAIGGGITAISGFSSGNVALGATGVLSAIQSIAVPATQKLCGGMQGSILGAILGNNVTRWQQFRLAVTSRNCTDTPENMQATLGNACMKVRSLTGLTGYCQTAGASVSAAATDEELTAINAMLDSGIYIE